MLTRTRRRNPNYDPNTMFNRGIIAQTGYIPEGVQFLQDTWRLQVKDTKKVMTEGFGGREVPIYRVTGLFQRADDVNANGRVYPKGILREAVDAIQEDVKLRTTLGEYDHPSDAKIHLDRVSHLITKLWMEGRDVYGEAEILDNLPFGSQLKGLFDRKVTVGISSRGIGDMDVRDEGGREVYTVTEGYRFITWDVVSDPSVDGALLHLMEGKLVPLRKSKPVHKPQIIGKRTYEAMLVDEIKRNLCI